MHVVTKSPIRRGEGLMLKEGDTVVVTGIVREFTTVELERDLGWAFDPAIEARLRQQPVVVASAIDQVGKVASWSEAEPQARWIGIYQVTVATEPQRLVGSPNQLDSVPVRRVDGQGLWVGHSTATEIFVTPPNGTDIAAFKQGDEVDLRGKLGALPDPSEAKKQWKLSNESLSAMEPGALYIEADQLRKPSA